MAEIKLGRVSMTLKGPYSPEESYERLDVVSYKGSCYAARKGVRGTAPEEGEHWMLLAEKGGLSDTAAKLVPGRTINGVRFDGTENITVEDDTKLPKSGGTVTGSLEVTKALTVREPETDNEAASKGYTDRAIKAALAPGAERLKTARNIRVTGDVTGQAQFDGSADAVISAVIPAGTVSYDKTSGVQPKHTTATAKLTAAGWAGGTTQTVTVSGVTASNTVLYSAAPASFTAYRDAGIYASAQGAGSMTFTAEATPEAEITVNFVILDK